MPSLVNARFILRDSSQLLVLTFLVLAQSVELGDRAPAFWVCPSLPGLPSCTDTRVLEKASSFQADRDGTQLLILISSLLGCGFLGRVELSADGFGGCV